MISTTPESRVGRDRLRAWRRVVFLFVCFATLVALFYTEETVRGKRAWEKCRRELEAKGARLNWALYIPPPVPDEQNIFKAPKMSEWFVKETSAQGQDQSSKALKAQPFSPPFDLPYGNTNPVLVAELKVTRAGAEAGANKFDASWRLGSSATSDQAQKLLRDAFDALGQRVVGLQGPFLIFARAFDQIKSAQIAVEADEPPTAETIRKLFPGDTGLPGAGHLRVEASGSNAFRVWLSPGLDVAAPDYLAHTDQATNDFELIRAALTRPCARMDSNYQQPFAVPIPNFVTVRRCWDNGRNVTCCSANLKLRFMN
jgi:hypothetical protein